MKPVAVGALGTAVEGAGEPVCLGVKLEAGQACNTLAVIGLVTVKVAAVDQVAAAGPLASKAHSRS